MEAGDQELKVILSRYSFRLAWATQDPAKKEGKRERKGKEKQKGWEMAAEQGRGPEVGSLAPVAQAWPPASILMLRRQPGSL